MQYALSVIRWWGSFSSLIGCDGSVIGWRGSNIADCHYKLVQFLLWSHSPRSPILLSVFVLDILNLDRCHRTKINQFRCQSWDDRSCLAFHLQLAFQIPMSYSWTYKYNSCSLCNWIKNLCKYLGIEFLYIEALSVSDGCLSFLGVCMWCSWKQKWCHGRDFCLFWFGLDLICIKMSTCCHPISVSSCQ